MSSVSFSRPYPIFSLIIDGSAASQMMASLAPKCFLLIPSNTPCFPLPLYFTTIFSFNNRKMSVISVVRGRVLQTTLRLTLQSWRDS